VADVAKDFSSEIVDGGKDASRDDLPLDFGEPDFDLVKPGRVSGGKMKVDFGMLGQKLLDEFGFMGRERAGSADEYHKASTRPSSTRFC
jgi:hypothetical protein